jgi:hypothetical protein
VKTRFGRPELGMFALNPLKMLDHTHVANLLISHDACFRSDIPVSAPWVTGRRVEKIAN